MWQFKGFGASVLFLRLLGTRRRLNRGQYKEALLDNVDTFIIMSLIGGVVINLKEMKEGRDPRDMTDPKFMAAAILQGGGFGIYGDFLFADHNRFGGSALGTAFGPVGSTVEDALKLTVGNAQQAALGEDTNATKEAIRFAWRNMVPGSNVAWTKLAMERMLIERLEEWADPKGTAKAQRRMIKGRKRDFKQDYWWAPGDREPERQPDLGAAFPE
jgi:hypothetical protein